MERLSRYQNAFIRPSPSGGTLGGVARKTRETIMVCEAAGFDTIIIETVGIGQSETTVRSMVDFFLLLLLPGAGDELQGIKKGSVELADALVVNKAEGENFTRANLTRLSYKQALHYLMPATEGWETEVFTCSALHEEGIDVIWNSVLDFVSKTQKSGAFDKRRREQLLDWVYSMVEENLKQRFYNNPRVASAIPGIEASVLDGSLTPTTAVHNLLKFMDEHREM
jgi:LAO/AO transport system kinase